MFNNKYLILSILICFAPLLLITQERIREQDSDQLYQEALIAENAAKYDSAIYYYKEAYKAAQQVTDASDQIRCLIKISWVYSLVNQSDSAWHSINLAKDIYKRSQVNDQLLSSDIEKVAGSVLLDMRQFDSALILLKHSLALRKDLNGDKDTMLAINYNLIGNYFWYNNNYDSSLFYYRKALKQSSLMVQKENKEVAKYNQNIGISLANLGLYDEAEKFFLKSLDLKEKTLNKNDLSLSRIYYNLGKFYRDISKHDQALSYYSKSEEILLAHFTDDKIDLGYLYWNKGNCFIDKQDLKNANYYLLKALSIFEINLPINHPDLLSVYMNLGVVEEGLGFDNEALEYYAYSNNVINNPLIIKSLRNTANILSKLGRNSEANEFYLRSIYESRKFYSDYSQDLGLCFIYFGNHLIKSGEVDKGLNYLNESLNVFLKLYGPRGDDVAKAYLAIGDYYKHINDYNDASKMYQNAIISSFDGFNSDSFLINPDSTTSIFSVAPFYSLSKKAELSYLIFNHENDTNYLYLSYKTLKFALSLVEKFRETYTTSESRIALSNELRRSYNLILDVIFILYHNTNDIFYLEEFFKYSEKSKSSTLLFEVHENEAKIISNIPQNLREEERSYKLNIESFNLLLNQESIKENPDKNKINLWRSKVFYYKKSLDSLIQLFENNYPLYYQLKFEPKISNSSSIRQLVAKDQFIFDYILTDSNTYLIILSNENFIINKLGLNSDSLKTLISNLSNSFKEEAILNSDKDDFELFVKSSNKIYNFLILPFRELLKDNRLVVIPDGELLKVPFEVLVTKIPTSSLDYKNLSYLIYDLSISYEASATLMINKVNNLKQTKNNKVIAFAPTYDNLFSNDSINYLTTNIRTKLYPLPYVSEEVDGILTSFKGKSYKGKKALKEEFFLNVNNFDIIHLAMHTLIDDINPLNSTLVFYTDRDNDGQLHAYEIYNTELRCRLAVLSACNTGSGKLETGEGVMSLARAFFYAGIPSIVMTLWTVEDYPSSEIMINFYKKLKEGMTKDNALRMAKIEYLKKTSSLKCHPYFWAGYIIIGNKDPLHDNATNHKILNISLLFLTSTMLAIIIFYRIRIRKLRNKKDMGIL